MKVERKNNRKRNQSSQTQTNQFEQTEHRTPQEKIDTSPISPRNDNQRQYLNAMRTKRIILASGPAGVGKTWIAGAAAAEKLQSDLISKIIVTRPAVEAGEKLGFLPGEIADKYAPWLQAFRDVFDQRLGKTFVEYLLKRGKIEAAPLAYMRGRTFSNAIVILDEAQNVTIQQMKMFLTRIGENCVVIVNGDLNQKDIPGVSGFADAIQKISHLSAVQHVKFTRKDVVRSDICQEIVECYEGVHEETPE